MRIIAGEWRGRPIVAPKGDTTRPTADRTREALFSMLTSRVGSFEGMMVADLFAGSGALGLEALSRGAAHCLFVEQDKAALDALKANIAKLGAGSRSKIAAQSVLTLGPTTTSCDILFMDPPYHSGAGAVALDKLTRLGWIGPATWVSIETARDEQIEVAGFEADTVRDTGKARLHLFQRKSA